MGERNIGTIIAFALVAVAALSVSFYAVHKMKHGQQETVLLKAKVENLTQEQNTLRRDLQTAEAKHSDEARNLREALLQEELKNEALTKEFQRRPYKTAQNVETTENKESNASFSSKSPASEKN